MTAGDRVTWLAVEPGHHVARSDLPRIGSHAFAGGAERSMCGLQTRARTLGPSTDGARPCLICQRAVAQRQLARTLELGKTPAAPAFIYAWRVSARLPDRKGQRCAVLARGSLNSCLVVFEDGYQVITSRNYLCRAPGART